MPLAALLILAFPIVEIAGFILVGRWIGLLPTLGLILLTSFVGVVIIRGQLVELTKLANKQSAQNPAPDLKTMLRATAQGFAGLLLVLPGFVTDILGILLLIPFVRQILWDRLKPRVNFKTSGPKSNSQNQNQHGFHPERGQSAPIVDLDENEYRRDEKGPSPRSKLPPE